MFPQYEIQDAEDTNNLFRVGEDSIIPLMTQLQLEGGIFFPKDIRVLALYPDTTTFYPATVIAPRPSDGKAMIMF